MNTLEIYDRGVKVSVPSHWDEMTPDQLKYILRQACLFTSGAIGYYDFIVRSFYRLAGIRRSWRTLLWERLVPAALREEKNANAFILARQYCEFLLKKNKDGQLEICYDTAVNHFPRLQLEGVTWYGPADLLSDLTFGEFRAATEEMNSYFRDKEDDALLRMIACLYRPAAADQRPEGIVTREPFNRAKLDIHCLKLRRLPEWQRLAILLWFTWCINYIQSETLIIEGRELSLKPLFPKGEDSGGSAQTSAGLGWTGILFAIAKEGLFGTIEQTDKASLFDVLLYMYDNHMQQKRNRKP